MDADLDYVTLDSITPKQLPRLKESPLRTKIIIPLLEEIGFDYVKDYHGAEECGIDVLFETNDFFKRRRFFGISAKRGDLHKKSETVPNSLVTVYNQIREAFFTPFFSSNNQFVHLHGYYIIISGSINRPAEMYIQKVRTQFPYVDLIDGAELFRIIRERDELRERYRAWKRNPYQTFVGEEDSII
jgi:hypothetical protein